MTTGFDITVEEITASLRVSTSVSLDTVSKSEGNSKPMCGVALCRTFCWSSCVISPWPFPKSRAIIAVYCPLADVVLGQKILHLQIVLALVP